MKILLLEDNQKLNQTIKSRLEMKDYEVDAFTDGQKAFDAMCNGYACFVLDINVPNINGIKILKEIRSFYKDIPVVIISSSVELEQIKESYNLGCNDYIKKPFYVDELDIKIQKLCGIQDTKIKIDQDVYFDYKTSIIYITSKEVKLTKKERFLLNLFLMNKNSLVSFEAIENYVWKGAYVSSDSIRTLIRRLRKCLPKEYIQTVVDSGYIFKV